MSILPAAGLFIVAGAGALPDLFEVVWNGGSAGCNARPDTMISLTPYATGFASNTTSVSLCRVYYRCTIYMHDGRYLSKSRLSYAPSCFLLRLSVRIQVRHQE